MYYVNATNYAVITLLHIEQNELASSNKFLAVASLATYPDLTQRARHSIAGFRKVNSILRTLSSFFSSLEPQRGTLDLKFKHRISIGNYCWSRDRTYM